MACFDSHGSHCSLPWTACPQHCNQRFPLVTSFPTSVSSDDDQNECVLMAEYFVHFFAVMNTSSQISFCLKLSPHTCLSISLSPFLLLLFWIGSTAGNACTQADYHTPTDGWPPQFNVLVDLFHELKSAWSLPTSSVLLLHCCPRQKLTNNCFPF